VRWCVGVKKVYKKPNSNEFIEKSNIASQQHANVVRFLPSCEKKLKFYWTCRDGYFVDFLFFVARVVWQWFVTFRCSIRRFQVSPRVDIHTKLCICWKKSLPDSAISIYIRGNSGFCEAKHWKLLMASRVFNFFNSFFVWQLNSVGKNKVPVCWKSWQTWGIEHGTAQAAILPKCKATFDI
jgi:hypothetical protein